jgi:hypothetical protein
MAFQGKSILDGFSGSVGDFTGYKLNGKSIIKRKNSSTTKNITDLQSQTRMYFKWINIILEELRNKGWGELLNVACNEETIRTQFIKSIPILFGKGLYQTTQLNLFCNTDSDVRYDFASSQFEDRNFYHIIQRSTWASKNSKPTDQMYRIRLLLGSDFAEVNQYGTFPRSSLGTRSDSISQKINDKNIAILICGWVSNDFSRRFNSAIQRSNWIK